MYFLNKDDNKNIFLRFLKDNFKLFQKYHQIVQCQHPLIIR